MTTSTDHGEGFISEIDESTIPMSFLDTDLYKVRSVNNIDPS